MQRGKLFRVVEAGQNNKRRMERKKTQKTRQDRHFQPENKTPGPNRLRRVEEGPKTSTKTTIPPGGSAEDKRIDLMSFPLTSTSVPALEDPSIALSLGYSIRSVNKSLFRFRSLLGRLLGLGRGLLLLLTRSGGALGSRLGLGRGPQGLRYKFSGEIHTRPPDALTRLSRSSCMIRVESL